MAQALHGHQAETTRPRIHHATVSSTQDAALELLHARVAATPFWLTANAQEDGRGRLGRHWVSRPGNFYGTLAFAPTRPLAEWPTLTFAISLAVHDALLAASAALGAGLRLKWPNDVLFNRARVAGILLERQEDANGTPVLLAGMGINLRHAPEQPERPAMALVDAGLTATADQLFPNLDSAMRARLSAWDRGGFAALRDDWLARADGLGGDITVNRPEGALEGRWLGLSPDGTLRLQTAPGAETTIAAGDVILMGEPAPRGDEVKP